MREWTCVQVDHHASIGETIAEMEKNGWRLHTYACAGTVTITYQVNHYLLFERENKN